MHAPKHQLPIGVFDSGVGGLTVLKAIREVLPYEDLLYLGDTARLPYGTKSADSVRRYARQATGKLRERGIKLLVVACNTASAVALDTLRKELAPLPVLGVVEPGAAAAARVGSGASHLVLATEATVRLGAYKAAILARDPRAEVRELACELLVALAEEGWRDGAIPPAIVRRYLEQMGDASFSPDCVILGCTHFPILRDAIASVFEAGMTIVDSATTTAAVTRQEIERLGLGNPQRVPGRFTFLATDGARRFARVGTLFLGQALTADEVTVVDL